MLRTLLTNVVMGVLDNMSYRIITNDKKAAEAEIILKTCME